MNMNDIKPLFTTNLLSVGEKCEELGISRMTLYRHIKKGRIRSFRFPGSKRQWFMPKAVPEKYE